jgi:hypothetical protein
MRNLIKAVVVAAASAPLALGLAAAAPAGATVVPAASFGCNTNDGGFCGSFEFKAPADQVFNVFHGGQGARGQKITEWTASDAVNTDFYAVNENGLSGSGGPDKTFEYAPNGHRSGWCISFPNTAQFTGAVLRHCNSSVWQTFKPLYVDGTFVAWKNLASGFVITDPGYASNGTRQLLQEAYLGTKNQQEKVIP